MPIIERYLRYGAIASTKSGIHYCAKPLHALIAVVIEDTLIKISNESMSYLFLYNLKILLDIRRCPATNLLTREPTPCPIRRVRRLTRVADQTYVAVHELDHTGRETSDNTVPKRTRRRGY